MSASQDCPRVGRWIGACRFRPRYDIGSPTVKTDRMWGFDLAGIIEASKPQSYVHDVCIRCGKTVQRPEPRT